MDIIMRMTQNSDSIYAYVRSIVNRDRGKVLGIFNDPETGKAVIIAEVNSHTEVDKGYNLVMESIIPGWMEKATIATGTINQQKE